MLRDFGGCILIIFAFSVFLLLFLLTRWKVSRNFTLFLSLSLSLNQFIFTLIRNCEYLWRAREDSSTSSTTIPCGQLHFFYLFHSAQIPAAKRAGAMQNALGPDFSLPWMRSRGISLPFEQESFSQKSCNLINDRQRQERRTTTPQVVFDCEWIVLHYGKQIQNTNWICFPCFYVCDLFIELLKEQNKLSLTNTKHTHTHILDVFLCLFPLASKRDATRIHFRSKHNQTIISVYFANKKIRRESARNGQLRGKRMCTYYTHTHRNSDTIIRIIIYEWITRRFGFRIWRNVFTNLSATRAFWLFIRQIK